MLLHAKEPSTGERFWLAPGGGVEPDETLADAARRELREETGLDAGELGPLVWTRRHRYEWGGRTLQQDERFFVVTAADETVAPLRPDDYITGHRWWSLDELQAAPDRFAPRRLPHLIEDILLGRYPAAPFDCGV